MIHAILGLVCAVLLSGCAPRAGAPAAAESPGAPVPPAGDLPAGAPAAPSGGPPTAALPAPADAADAIQQLVAKYELASITGDAATSENLARLDQAYGRLPPAYLKGLRIIMQKTDQGQSVDEEGAGLWMPVDAGGKVIEPPVKDPSQIAGGQITYIGAAPHAWVYVHEVGHHVTLWQEAAFGRELIEALGYDVPASGTILSTPDEQVKKTRVAASEYPTDYAKQNHTEHAAELFAEHLTPDLATGTVKLKPTFRLSEKARAVLDAKLGPQKRGPA